MFKKIKDLIKTKPVVYDCLNSLRPLNDELTVWINKFSKHHKGKIKFIQVGASDGLRWDPLRRFILRDRWKGVLIEPLSPVFELLKYNYSFTSKCELYFENCVISSCLDSIKFWTYSDKFLDPLSIEDRLYYLRKSSIDLKLFEKGLVGLGDANEIAVCYSVPSYPLSVIIEKYFSDYQVDLVFIDAEGHDDEVIKSIDFNKCNPRAICYESHNLGAKNTEIESFLMSKGYTVTIIAGDTVAELKGRSVS